MRDPATMSPVEKYVYIFDKNQCDMFPGGRFNWLPDCLLGDIRTFLDGIENYVQNIDLLQDRGGGNLSVLILISTGLELASALYAGKTSHKDGREYRARVNVKQFITDYYPENYHKFPLIFWDGVRNGLTHMFSPTPFQYLGKNIRFQFFTEEDFGSHITDLGDTILVRLSVFKMFEVLKQAMQDYGDALRVDEILQDNFITAWSSIEEYSRNIDSQPLKANEVQVLLSELKDTNNYLIL